MSRAARRDDIVTVEGFEGMIWRVISVSAGFAHMTKLTSSSRVDLRGIPVERLAVRPVFL
ncbi:MAG: hypothetical protein KGL39_26535 [Patescibacteria group bacterium]|nr:hypothetical protein [Patescibacteria group bacterium]